MNKAITIRLFFASLPVILFLLIQILPTFDDWTYLTAPDFGDPFAADRILPSNGYWRPFDALIGSILGLNHHLFPTLNHFIILLGHAIATYLVYRLAERSILSALFFFLSPGMLGTVLDIDSANQAYATCWGLASLLFYMQGRKGLWMLCVVIATFCKENGIVYAVIPPLMHYFQQPSLHNVKKQTNNVKQHLSNIKPYLRDMLPMMSLVAVYAAARILLTPADDAIKDDYLTPSLADHAKDLVLYIAGTWLPIDYEAIVFPPTRCIPLALLTLLLAIPFLVVLARKFWNNRNNRMIYAMIALYFLAAAPHLLTLVSLMHVYAGLPFAALIINMLCKQLTRRQNIAVTLFLTAALITDIHHGYAAYQSGIVGKEMAEDVLKKSKTLPQSVYIINIDNGEKKYSTFNVIPRDAFGWGRAAGHYSDYTCAQSIEDTTITASGDNSTKQRIIQDITKKVEQKNTYDALWVVDGKNISILFER